MAPQITEPIIDLFDANVVHEKKVPIKTDFRRTDLHLSQPAAKQIENKKQI